MHQTSATDQSDGEPSSLDDLVLVEAGGDLPLVRDLDPYSLGATKTYYGDSATYGLRDPYVPRTRDRADEQIRTALAGSRLVIVHGVSKAGKTRTAFEAIQSVRPDSRLVAPTPSTLDRVINHPRLQGTDDSLVLWLDDLDEYLGSPNELTRVMLNRLWRRPGEAIVVATLREEAYARLRATIGGDLGREIRLLLNSAIEIELHPTDQDSTEHGEAARLYPAENLSGIGIGEKLAGARALLRHYRESRVSDPVQYIVIRTAIDWARAGLRRPITEAELIMIAGRTLELEHPLAPRDHQSVVRAIELARVPLVGEGRASALTPVARENEGLEYRPFDYLVAEDDARDITGDVWKTIIALATTSESLSVAHAAEQRNDLSRAVAALSMGAASGDPRAMINLSVRLQEVDPPDLVGARNWLEKAAATGTTDSTYAMHNLSVLLDESEPTVARQWREKAADAGNPFAMTDVGVSLLLKADPPDPAAAKGWFEKAVQAGEVEPRFWMGAILERWDEPPDLVGARKWYEKAAIAGHADAMVNLGFLLEGQEPPDLVGARKWYEKAVRDAEGGARSDPQKYAMFRLGLLLEDWAPPDFVGARKWYEKAAAAGHTDAMVNLGVLLQGQEPPDLVGARAWYEKAAAAGDTDAMLNLGLLLEKWAPPDFAGARAWYEKAVAASHPDAAEILAELDSAREPWPAKVWARVRAAVRRIFVN